MKAFEQILKDHIRYIQSQSYKMGIDDITIIQDLQQVGSIGLWVAYGKFDETKGVPFLGFAHWYVKKHMLEFLEKNLKTIKVPKKILAQLKKDGLKPLNAISLNTRMDADDTILEDFIENEPLEQSDPRLDRIPSMLSEVSPKHLKMIQMKMGLEPYQKEHTLREIGEEFGLSKEGVRQQINNVLNKIRKNEEARRI